MTDSIQNRLFHAISSGAAHDAESFAEVVLRDALDWPIPREPFGELPYEWTPDEIGVDASSAGKLAAAIKQVPPLAEGQPWGVFIIEMKEQELFRRERGMAGLLRRMLSGLIAKKVKKTDSPVWKREELLFILTHEYRDFRIAYFKNPPEGKKSAPLAVFGWLHGDTHIHTLCEMNLPALHWPGNPDNREEWVKKWATAFDVSKVTKQFYAEYDIVFKDLETGIKGVSGDEKRAFAQRLMNRLMFVYFIQKKGWLTFEGGDRNYLRCLYDASETARDDFLNDRLQELFFNGFNSNPENIDPQEKKRIEAIIGHVPYLNGGLFAHADDGTDAKGKVKISRGKIGNILRLFERYNFTISESTPLEIEVAVDPEMLGKVFEELVTGRHSTGSYYTPRPVVSFMCREALKAYLERSAGLSAEAAAKLVDEGDASDLNQTTAAAALKALDEMKAVDPACGSGAYLLGLLHEITAIQKSLFSEKLRRDSRSLHQSKLRIISNSLYGVDKDAFAVEIARLRLWLSLAVDSDVPQPLPNLDFKIETGDSLLSPNPETAGGGRAGNTSNMFRDQKVKRFEELKALFLTEGDEKKKARLRRDIAVAREELRTPGSIAGFDWRVEFGEVFTRSSAWLAHDGTMFPGASGSKRGVMFAKSMNEKAGGFDIVLANPPYVRQEELDVEMKKGLSKLYNYSVYTGRADLYCCFYSRGVELARMGGVLAFISSNKWLKATYGKKLRKWISGKCSVRSIIDFGELPIFGSVTTYPMIFVAEKKRVKTTGELLTLYAKPDNLETPYPDIKAMVEENGLRLPPGSLSGENWRLSDAASQNRFETMSKNGVLLKDYVDGKIFYGIKTGFNEAFVIDGEARDKLIREDRKSAEIIKPMLEGRDITRWRSEGNGRWLIFTRRGIDIKAYSAVYAHLKKYKTKLLPRPKGYVGDDWAGRKAGTYEWYEIQDSVDYYEEFEKPKIIFQIFQVKPAFAFDESGVYVNNAAYIIPTIDYFLLAILNSSPFWNEISRVCTPIRNGFQLMRDYFIHAIIPYASEKDKSSLEILSRKCIAKHNGNCQREEAEIDAIVTRLYGL